MKKPVLYLGLNPPSDLTTGEVVHLPLIEIIPYSIEKLRISLPLINFPLYTHLILTSKSAVKQLLECNFPKENWENKQIISIGQSTTHYLQNHFSQLIRTADSETSEGVITVLKETNLKGAHVFWPHSELSRKVIPDYFDQINCQFTECAVYTTEAIVYPSPPQLKQFSEIVFTSPSTVSAFFKNYSNIPQDIKVTSIGPVTSEALNKIIRKE